MDSEVRPQWDAIDQKDRGQVVRTIVSLRGRARDHWNLWLPHMPAEWGGMGLGPTAMAAVSAEAAKVSIGPFVLNAQAPDEGNQHTLLHWATDEQKEKYLRPLCEGTARSCFAMTEPEVAGSDPTLIKTQAYQDGDEWVINGHKWFISGARGAQFALLVARTEDNPDLPQAANSCFIVEIPSEGFNIVRDVETMSGGHNHCEILIQDLRVPAKNMLGGRGQGHLLGQYRLGPARLAHCMRWIGQAEIALDMMVDRALQRYSHGSILAEKQGIQWLIADSSMELYQCKLMVLHAAYKIENGQSFTSEVSMAKHLPIVCGELSIAQFKFTGRLDIRQTLRWRTCCNKPDGVVSPMVLMKSIRCALRNALSPLIKITVQLNLPLEICRYDYQTTHGFWSLYSAGLEDGACFDF